MFRFSTFWNLEMGLAQYLPSFSSEITSTSCGRAEGRGGRGSRGLSGGGSRCHPRGEGCSQRGEGAPRRHLEELDAVGKVLEDVLDLEADLLQVEVGPRGEGLELHALARLLGFTGGIHECAARRFLIMGHTQHSSSRWWWEGRTELAAGWGKRRRGAAARGAWAARELCVLQPALASTGGAAAGGGGGWERDGGVQGCVCVRVCVFRRPIGDGRVARHGAGERRVWAAPRGTVQRRLACSRHGGPRCFP